MSSEVGSGEAEADRIGRSLAKTLFNDTGRINLGEFPYNEDFIDHFKRVCEKHGVRPDGVQGGAKRLAWSFVETVVGPRADVDLNARAVCQAVAIPNPTWEELREQLKSTQLARIYANFRAGGMSAARSRALADQLSEVPSTSRKLRLMLARATLREKLGLEPFVSNTMLEKWAVRRTSQDQPSGCEAEQAACSEFVRLVDGMVTKENLQLAARIANTASPTLSANTESCVSSDISAELQDLLAASNAYIDDLKIGISLKVQRKIECQVVNMIKSRQDTTPAILLIGEAGHGKSTLLWSIHQTLSLTPQFVPLLMSAGRLWPRPNATPFSELVIQLQALQAHDSKVVILLDTVDLLLHSEGDRQLVAELVTLMRLNKIPLIMTSRPQEAATLSSAKITKVQLGPYSDTELADAARRLSKLYCPRVDAESITSGIAAATARGVPASDVCRNPLHLRMLFDICSPEPPWLKDMDVTGLHKAYWNRRIIRDARTETSLAVRSEPSADLSSTAESIAIELLIRGVPELPSDELLFLSQGARRADNTLSPPILQGVSILKERGVLTSYGDRTGFFHQTMLEFAAARGLLTFSGNSALEILTLRTTSGSGDLFVGAVLEQALILASSIAPLRIEAQQSTLDLVTCPIEAVRSIGMAAWSHDRGLLPFENESINMVGDAAVTRAARMLPAIASTPVSTRIDQLIVLWRSARSAETLAEIARSLARLALGDPEAVADAIELIDIADACKRHQSEALRRAVLEVLEALLAVAPDLVRSACLDMVAFLGSTATIELEFLADNWNAIGEGELFAGIKYLATSLGPLGQPGALALGRIQAAEWERTNTWENSASWNKYLSDLFSPSAVLDRADTTSSVFACLELLESWPRTDDRHRAFLRFILSASDSPAQITALRQIGRLVNVSAKTQFAKVVIEELSGTLANVGDNAARRQVDRCQRNSLKVLLAAGRVYSEIPRPVLSDHIRFEEWLLDSDLASVVGFAAEGGNPSAISFMCQIADNPGAFTARQLGLVFGWDRLTVGRSDVVFKALVSSLMHQERIKSLVRLLNSTSPGDNRWNPFLQPLFDIAESLIFGSNPGKADGVGLLAALMYATRQDGFNWPRYRKLIRSTSSDETVAALIAPLGVLRDDYSLFERIAFLEELVSVDPAGCPPIQAAGHGVPKGPKSVDAAASALLCLLSSQAPIDRNIWPKIEVLGLYPPLELEVRLGDDELRWVFYYLERLSDRRPLQTGRYLISYLQKVAVGRLYVAEPDGWSDGLEAVVRAVCASHSSTNMKRLIRLTEELQYDIAWRIISTMADAAYSRLFDELHNLTSRQLPPELGAFVIETIQKYDRLFGTREFPELARLMAR